LFTAQIPKITEPGRLRDRVDEAWQSVKEGLIRGVSVGFRVLNDAMDFMADTGGIRFRETEVLELSLVAIPANVDATITSIKSFDERPAASGTGRPVVQSTPPRVTGSSRKDGKMTIQERIKGFENTRAAKVARMDEIQNKASDEGRTKDAAEKEEFATLSAEVKSIDEELVDLREMEELNKKAAKPVAGKTPDTASASRDGSRTPVIAIADNMPPGIGFARAAMCQAQALMERRDVLAVAKERYPDFGALHNYITKGNVPAGTTTETTWAAPLVYATNLATEFIDFMRPQTIIGKFGANGIPALTRVPFNVRVPSQTGGGDAWWVGEGAPKPLTSFAFSSVSLAYLKVASIAVITKELARFSTPAAETLVRDQLARACVERIDVDFIDPAHAATANVSPASITNGLTALTSAGTSADNARTDLVSLLVPFIEANYNPANIVLIMPNTLALALSLMRNSLGQPEFPTLTANGGTLQGIPVITSQYAANVSGGGNLVIAVSARDIFLADDGNVSVDASQEASLQLLDNPTNNSAVPTATTMVSMYQTNSIALRAEREITWAKARTDAVVYMDDVNWNSVGSP
jgi:HK97 family phage major capsid protein